MSYNFKQGDLVVCVDASYNKNNISTYNYWLEDRKIYEVRDVYKLADTHILLLKDMVNETYKNLGIDLISCEYSDLEIGYVSTRFRKIKMYSLLDQLFDSVLEENDYVLN